MDHYFDVLTALHDDVKRGGDYPKLRSRVVISATAYPHTTQAAEVACTLAVAIHGGMAVACYLRI
jgi:hypothetical protein